MEKIQHNIDPVYDENSRILILGSFPSVKSRAAEFFYAHPQNRFWRVTAAVRGCAVPETVEEKKRFLLDNHIALWDVIGSCEISASADSSIRNAEINDFSRIFNAADIRAVFTNGAAAYNLYRKFAGGAIRLPSTSPANAAKSLDVLIAAWRVINEYIDGAV